MLTAGRRRDGRLRPPAVLALRRRGAAAVPLLPQGFSCREAVQVAPLDNQGPTDGGRTGTQCPALHAK
jgi:hypothetical protein